MKRLLLACASISLLAGASCGTDATVKTGSGGQTGSGSGGASSGSGGAATGGTSGGETSSGGTVGSGGATVGTGGTTTTGSGGKATASGGVEGATGGVTGSGGAVPGTGGTVSSTGGSGPGGAVGTGGAQVSTGGAQAGGHPGTGGAAPGTGGAAGATSAMSVAAAWDGQLVTFPCGSSGSGYDCANVGCVNNAATKMTTWAMAGTASGVYSVTFNVRGIVEAYSYVGGTRDGGSVTNNLDLFQRGGMQQASGGSNYDYNTYELDVSPGVTGEPNVYFLNSVTSAEGPHASNSPTQHLTFPIDYTKTIKVMGNSMVTLKVFDSNCTLVQNCGPTMGNTCAAPRTVSLAGVMPAAPSSFMQPYQMPTGKYGQWVYFDITNVTAN